jgi:hypothetical protein
MIACFIGKSLHPFWQQAADSNVKLPAQTLLDRSGQAEVAAEALRRSAKV